MYVRAEPALGEAALTLLGVDEEDTVAAVVLLAVDA
jgi:hypothetical protein